MSPKKPDWFVLTEGDKRPQPKHRKRLLGIAAFGAPALIITAGIFAAQSSDPNKADAESTPTVTAQVVTPTPEPTPDEFLHALEATQSPILVWQCVAMLDLSGTKGGE